MIWARRHRRDFDPQFDLASGITYIARHLSSNGPVIYDCRGRRPKGGAAYGMRLNFLEPDRTQHFNPRDAVSLSASSQLIERRKF
jgi:hypothetical protein